jgi:hypothetical protein
VNRTQTRPPATVRARELSMRILEYAICCVAVGAALVLSLGR